MNQNFIPELIDHQLYDYPTHTVIESNASGQQVILPSQSKLYLKYLNGESSIKEIVDKVNNQGDKFSFKEYLSTLDRLNSSQFFTDDSLNLNLESSNSQIYNQASWFERKFGFKFKILSSKKIELGLPRFLFWPYVLLPFLLGGLGLVFAFEFLEFDNDLFRFDKSYFLGALIIYISMFLMKSIKEMYKLIFSIFFNKKIPNLFLSFDLIPTLSVEDESFYYSAGKLKGLFILFGQIMIYMGISGIAFAISNSWWYANISLAALILTFSDLNPFRKSELSRLLRLNYSSSSDSQVLSYLKKRSLIAVLDPNVQTENQTLISTYSAVSILWIALFFNLCLKVFNETLSNLVVAVIYGEILEKLSAIVILATVGGLALRMVYVLSLMIWRNLMSPIAPSLAEVRKSISTKSIDMDKARLVDNLKKTPVFSQLSDSGLKFIIENSKVVQLGKGSPLIVQGVDLDEAYFLINGTVRIFHTTSSGDEKYIGSLSDNRLLGESAFLQASEKATSHIVAEKDIQVLEIPGHLLQVLKERPEFESDYHALKRDIAVLGYLRNVDLFSGLPHEITSLIVQVGQTVRRGMGQRVIEEGAHDRDFYVILSGKVQVSVGDKVIKELKKGDFFGEIALLKNAPRTATVSVMNEAILLKLSQDNFWKLLCEYPQLGLFIESVSKMRTADESGLSPEKAS